MPKDETALNSGESRDSRLISGGGDNTAFFAE